MKILLDILFIIKEIFLVTTTVVTALLMLEKLAPAIAKGLFNMLKWVDAWALKRHRSSEVIGAGGAKRERISRSWRVLGDRIRFYGLVRGTIIHCLKWIARNQKRCYHCERIVNTEASERSHCHKNPNRPRLRL